MGIPTLCLPVRHHSLLLLPEILLPAMATFQTRAFEQEFRMPLRHNKPQSNTQQVLHIATPPRFTLRRPPAPALYKVHLPPRHPSQLLPLLFNLRNQALLTLFRTTIVNKR